MTMRFRILTVWLSVGLGAACGDEELGGGSLVAPTLDEVEPMHGALHLYWTNETPDCDAVEGERKTASGSFESFFSVPGSVDNEADDDATDAGQTYTYRLRCVRGDETSAYSNEVSASPE